MSDFAAIILAAGFSSRMTGFKPLLPLGGCSVLARVVGLFREAGVQRIVVVTGHQAEEIAYAVKNLGCGTTHNAAYAEGMFSSVRTGVAALPESCAGFFMLPVDIPLVRPQTVRHLHQSFDAAKDQVLIPTFHGEEGHPPLISADAAPMILKSDGEGGLRRVLEHMEKRHVPVPDSAVLLDMDTDEDYARLKDVSRNMSLPTPDECAALMEFMSLPERVRSHCAAVARAALVIGQSLNKKLQKPLDLRIIERAALVHDLAKGSRRHEEEGGRILRQWGFDAVADIVAAHRDVSLPAEVRITENEVVFMADKLVAGSGFTPLEERYEAVLRRHGHDPEARAAIEGRRERARTMLARLDAASGGNMAELVREELERA